LNKSNQLYVLIVIRDSYIYTAMLSGSVNTTHNYAGLHEVNQSRNYFGMPLSRQSYQLQHLMV